jgi:D-beta-D-heptose 7-phosphate kinase/D-beta-D-heptose 1-phosphate adenosyltransferase
VGFSSNLLEAVRLFRLARIGVLGDLMIDRFVYGTVNRISPEAPVPVLAVSSKLVQPGGAANTAVNVMSLGGMVRLFGILGDDHAAHEVLEILAEHGADSSGVVLLPDRPSTVKTRIVAQSQQVVRIDEEDASPLPTQVSSQLMAGLLEALPELDLLVVSDYAKGVINKPFAEQVVRACQARQIRVVVDPKPAHAAAFAGASVIKPNLGEALSLTGHPAEATYDPNKLCAEVSRISRIPGVVVTAGARGMYVLDDGELTHLPGVAREVYDVAGAGDSVLAALALGLASNLRLTDSARLGNLAGSIAVGHLGVAAVKAEELQAALEDQHDIQSA